VDLTLEGQHNQISRLLHKGELMAAAERCKRVLRTFPRDVTTYYLLGRVLLELGQHRPAADLFRRVLSVDPEHVMAIAGLGAIYEGRGLISEALWQMERALELSPANREIRSEVLRLREERDLAPAQRIKTNRAGLARVYLRGGLYAKAIGELRELVADEPHRHDLRVSLARALWLDGRFVEVEAACQAVLGQLPNCIQANLLLGRVWLNSPRDAQAREMLQLVQALDPDNRASLALFGPKSPLPPRTARLPFESGDAPPLELPYLADGTEESVEDEVIEQGLLPQSTSEAEPVTGQVARDVVSARVQDHWPEDLSDEDDALARARHLWMLGDLEQSVRVLRRIMERFPRQVQRVYDELTLMNRLHAGRVEIVEALWYTRRLLYDRAKEHTAGKE